MAFTWRQLNIEFRAALAANDIHPSCVDNKIVKEGRCTNGPCFHVDQLNEYTIENCTEPGTYDFFSNSRVSFIFTFLGVSTLFCGKNLIITYLGDISSQLTNCHLILTQVLLH